MRLSENQLTILTQELDLALMQGALIQLEPAVVRDLLESLEEIRDENLAHAYRIRELEEKVESVCPHCEAFRERAESAESALTDVQDHLRAILKAAA